MCRYSRCERAIFAETWRRRRRWSPLWLARRRRSFAPEHTGGMRGSMERARIAISAGIMARCWGIWWRVGGALGWPGGIWLGVWEPRVNRGLSVLSVGG